MMKELKSIFSVLLVCFIIIGNDSFAYTEKNKTVNETWSITIEDSYGDGWNGASISLAINGITQISNLTIESGSRPVTQSFEISCNDVITTTFFSGEDDDECSFKIRNANNTVVVEESGPPNDIVYTYNCSNGESIWTGQIDSDWNNRHNWSTGEIPTPFQNVVIPNTTNQPIIYQNESADCYNLNLESGAILIIENKASIITNGEIVNNGSIQVKKSISANKWHLFSIPNEMEASETFTDDYLQDWDECSGSWREIVGLSTYLAAMEGYGLYTNTRRDYIFNGTPNTGMLNHPLSYTDYSSDPMAAEGANLIGNPYPSSLDWSYLDDIWGAIYIWNPDYNNGDGTYGKYMSWNNGNSTNGGSQYIAPMQAFFIIVDEQDNGNSLVLSNNYRSHIGATEYYKSENKSKNSIVLQALTNGSADELCIRFNENASDAYEKQYDALKLFSNSMNSCQLYSITNDKLLSIDVRPETETVQLGLRNEKSGRYQIAAKEITGISKAEIEDRKYNSFHDLGQGAYEFDWTTSDSEERFILHLKATGTEEMEAQDVQVYTAGGQVYVRLDQVEDFQEIIFYDLAGRVVFESNLSNQSLQNFNLGSYSGAILVQLKGKIKTRTKKMVLQ